MDGLTKKELPVIKLDEPCTWGNQEISEIKYLRPVLTKHLYGMDITNMTTRHHASIASQVTNLPVPFFGELPPYEMLKVVEVNLSFFENSRPTGPSS